MQVKPTKKTRHTVGTRTLSKKAANTLNKKTKVAGKKTRTFDSDVDMEQETEEEEEGTGDDDATTTSSNEDDDCEDASHKVRKHDWCGSRYFVCAGILNTKRRMYYTGAGRCSFSNMNTHTHGVNMQSQASCGQTPCVQDGMNLLLHVLTWLHDASRPCRARVGSAAQQGSSKPTTSRGSPDSWRFMKVQLAKAAGQDDMGGGRQACM